MTERDEQLKKRGDRRIVNRLRKLGVNVPSRHKGGSSRSTPWDEDDLYALAEVWEEGKGMPEVTRWDFVCGDIRLAGKTKKSIKEQLVGLGLIKGKTSKPVGEGARRRSARRGGGGSLLDATFVTTLKTTAQQLRDKDVASEEALAWLCAQVSDHVAGLKSGEVNDGRDLNPPEDLEGAGSLRPLIGLLGFRRSEGEVC